MSADPFYAFRDELERGYSKLQKQHSQWQSLRDGGSTASPTFHDANYRLLHELEKVETGLAQVRSMVQMITASPERFPHIDRFELQTRKAFLLKLREGFTTIQKDVRSRATRDKISQDKRRAKQVLERERKMKITGPGTKANGGSGHGAFNRSGGAMQSQLLEKQDEQLDTMHDGAVRLGELSDAIGAELEDQGRKLDALGSDMDKVQSGMDHVMGKMEELLQTKNRLSIGFIIFLMIVAMVLLCLVLWA